MSDDALTRKTETVALFSSLATGFDSGERLPTSGSGSWRSSASSLGSACSTWQLVGAPSSFQPLSVSGRGRSGRRHGRRAARLP